MATWDIPSGELNVKASFEDQYYDVKRERDQIKETLNGLGEENRILRTRCAQLETFKKRVASGADANQLIDTLGKPREIHELQQDYDDLFKCYESIQREYRAIVAKHKSSLRVIGKQKREIQSLRLRCGSGMTIHRNPSKRQTGGCRRKVSDLQVEELVTNKENVENALGHLQLRLSNAEEELRVLKTNPHIESHGSGPSENVKSTTKLHMLQAQHKLDESRIKAQGDKLEKILSLHKEYKARHGALKKELDLCQEENEDLEFRITQLEECREQAEELTEENLFLEDKVRKLTCCLPKADGHHAERKMMKLEMQEKQRECELLTEENKELRMKINSLNSQLKSAGQYFANHPRQDYASPTAPHRLGDVWQQLDHAQQQCCKLDRDLQHANQLFQSQVAITQKVQSKMKTEIKSRDQRIDRLSFKAVQRLQKIRQLESRIAVENPAKGESLPNNLPEDQNVLEIKINSASLGECLFDETKSFALVDFLAFDSEISEIVPGSRPLCQDGEERTSRNEVPCIEDRHPGGLCQDGEERTSFTYNFTVVFNIKMDSLCSQFLAKGEFVRIEIYTLQKENPPVLFGYATVLMSDLMDPLSTVHIPRLNLVRVGDKRNVGTLNVTLRLAKRPPHVISATPRENEFGATKCRRYAVPGAVSISVESVTLLKFRDWGDNSFHVHYRFLSFCDVLTTSISADAAGVIAFRHKSTFPLLSTDDGSLEPVLSSISRGILHFTLFSGRNTVGTNEKELRRFDVVGVAQVPLREIWGHAKLTKDIISFDAKVAGSMSMTFHTSVQPKSEGVKNNMRQSAQSRFITLLTEVALRLEGDITGTINTQRLLRFVDPPGPILNTARLLQQQLVIHCQGRHMSELPAFPQEGKTIDQAIFQRCIEEIQRKGLLPGMPPAEEMEDIFQYLSNSKGLVCICDLNNFIASKSLKILAATFQELRSMKQFVRDRFSSIEDESGSISIQGLKDYVADQFNDIGDGELAIFFSLLCGSLDHN